MKNLIILAFIFSTFTAFSQFNRDPYRDADQGNFYLRNGKVFFQRTYNYPVSFEQLEKKLQSYNTPNAGFQTKSKTQTTMNGVMLNYHLNWNYNELKSRKIPAYLKSPANATFEIEKTGNAYQVTVNNIWFAGAAANGKSALNLEEIVTGKGGVVFTKKKRPLRVLKMMDQNFEWIFNNQGNFKDTRF